MEGNERVPESDAVDVVLPNFVSALEQENGIVDAPNTVSADGKRKSTSSSSSEAIDATANDLPVAGHRKEPSLSTTNIHRQKWNQERIERMKGIHGLDVNPRIIQVLRKMKLNTVRDILSVTPIDLRNASLTRPEVDELLQSVAKIWWGSPLNYYRVSAIPSPTHLSFGCPLLDQLFHGGIHPGQLTEFFGAAGSGKTQICLVLALRAQLPVLSGGLKGETLYVCTEFFPSRRLKQMTDAMASSFPDSESGIIPSMDRIYIENLTTLEELESYLSNRVHDLLNRVPIKLIILDSIANVFRYQLEEKVEPLKQAERLQQIAMTLRRLQHQYSVAVVCANQATTFIEEQPDNGPAGSESVVTAALGLAWSNFVNTRVMLRRSSAKDTESGVSAPRRFMQIIFASHLPQTQVEFEVFDAGVRGVGKVHIGF